eukprot:9211049-Alexandrium_andersonii.AAC.1
MDFAPRGQDPTRKRRGNGDTWTLTTLRWWWLPCVERMSRRASVDPPWVTERRRPERTTTRAKEGRAQVPGHPR